MYIRTFQAQNHDVRRNTGLQILKYLHFASWMYETICIYINNAAETYFEVPRFLVQYNRRTVAAFVHDTTIFPTFFQLSNAKNYIIPG